MKRVILCVAAGALGVLAGGTVVAAIEGVSSLMYPLPEGLDVNDREAMAAHVATLPTAAFLFVLSAWSAGAWVAAVVSRLVTPERGMVPAIVAVFLLWLGGLANLLMLPHPIWMWPVGLSAFPVFGWLGILVTTPRGDAPDADARAPAT